MSFRAFLWFMLPVWGASAWSWTSLWGETHPDGAELIGWWKLEEDTRDFSSHSLHAVNHGVRFEVDRNGTRAATFDGRGAWLEIPSDPRLRLVRDDFCVALWVYTDETLDDDFGDLVTLYEPVQRVGFNLALRNNTGVTTCQANTRQLQFGIDAGTEPKWRDVGRPGNAVFVMALAVHDGYLYAGTSSNGPNETGRVFRYDGPGRWIDLGSPDKANAISAMAVHNARLYVASSRYRFAGSALPESPNVHPGGGVYRWEPENRWVEVGRLPQTEAIGGLVVYKGQLYASSLYKPAGFFRYEQDGVWTSLPTPEEHRVESLGVFNGFLWATSYDGGRIYRFDGETWKDCGQLGDNTQTYSFAVHEGKLCVGTWPSGKVFRLIDQDSWQEIGRLGEEREVMGMLVHNGKLYAGTLPSAEVYRYDGGRIWTKTARLDLTADVTYRRAWTMAQYAGQLFCGTLPSGHVHAMEAGVCVTCDHEVPAGWRHVAAVKSQGKLALYVDGKRVAESAAFDPARFDLTTDAPLRIGAGAGDFFRGRIRDVRFYRGSLGPSDVARLAQERPTSR